MCRGGAGGGEGTLPPRYVVELAGAPPGVGGVVDRPGAGGGASEPVTGQYSN